jgi:hypothetical protein
MSKLNYQETFNNLLKIEKSDIKVMSITIEPLFRIADTIDVYKDDNLAHQYGIVVAGIAINPISLKPFIVIDSIFDRLSTRTKLFVLYHELGHYQNGDFTLPRKKNSIINSISEAINYKLKYPEREVLADYYAMEKMDSFTDVIDSIHEMYDVIEKALTRKDNSKETNKSLKLLMSLKPKRVRDLTKMFQDGPYYINEGPKQYDDVLEIESFEYKAEPIVCDNPSATLKLEKTDIEDTSIVFRVSENELLKLAGNGDIYVKGKMIENDKQVVDALRELIQSSNKMNQIEQE